MCDEMTDGTDKFEQLNICCPSDSGSKYVWEAQLDYEKTETLPNRMHIEELLNNLKNPSRLSILLYLMDRVNCVCELVKKLKMANSAVSYHLSYLIDNSFVSASTQGGNKYYSLTPFGKTCVEWLKTAPIADLSESTF